MWENDDEKEEEEKGETWGKEAVEWGSMRTGTERLGERWHKMINKQEYLFCVYKEHGKTTERSGGRTLWENLPWDKASIFRDRQKTTYFSQL